ncbi:hypothetical protein M9978_16600 [Sphingomonas sp. MG17]|uniref:Uncharacterized protein n=1 Tax=Sphingomonas tagetis TaxID=2949092 RepID=A0A9X2HIY5_9SPHN|nr:hypothetical protein [Sphingomonas tagetis]MCP3732046.1 hypothetical protein [Sphingomonas tagetis]
MAAVAERAPSVRDGKVASKFQRTRRTKQEVEDGLAYARAWRVRTRPYFDELYPETVSPVRCSRCDQFVPASHDLASAAQAQGGMA